MNVLTMAKRIAKDAAKALQAAAAAGEGEQVEKQEVTAPVVLKEEEVPNRLGRRTKRARVRGFLSEYSHRQYQANERQARPTAHKMPAVKRWPAEFRQSHGKAA